LLNEMELDLDCEFEQGRDFRDSTFSEGKWG
jgi:hypothetical protein